MKLAVFRHTVTEWNRERRVQGRIDQPLSAAGRDQVARLTLPARFLAYEWYTSPLQRARETATLLGIDDPRVEAALVEMNWGDWEGQVLKQLRRQLGDSMRANEARGIDFRPPGGESPRDVQSRLHSWLTEVAPGCAALAAVAHQGTIRCLYSMATGWDMCGETPVDFDWNALHLFETDATGRLLDRYDSLSLDSSA